MAAGTYPEHQSRIGRIFREYLYSPQYFSIIRGEWRYSRITLGALGLGKRNGLAWIDLDMRSMKGQGSLERLVDAAGRAIAEGARDPRLLAIVHAHKPGVGAAVNVLVEHSGGLVDARDPAHTA